MRRSKCGRLNKFIWECVASGRQRELKMHSERHALPFGCKRAPCPMYEKSSNLTKWSDWCACSVFGITGWSGTLASLIVARRWNLLALAVNIVYAISNFSNAQNVFICGETSAHDEPANVNFRWQKTTLMFRIWIRANVRHCIMCFQLTTAWAPYTVHATRYTAHGRAGIGRWYRGKSTCLNMGIHLDKISNTHSRAFTHSAHGTRHDTKILPNFINVGVSACQCLGATAHSPLPPRPAPSQACQTLRTTQSACHKNECSTFALHDIDAERRWTFLCMMRGFTPLHIIIIIHILAIRFGYIIMFKYEFIYSSKIYDQKRRSHWVCHFHCKNIIHTGCRVWSSDVAKQRERAEHLYLYVMRCVKGPVYSRKYHIIIIKYITM